MDPRTLAWMQAVDDYLARLHEALDDRTSAGLTLPDAPRPRLKYEGGPPRLADFL